ncbi:SCO1860 family LAETG-anchored protein [Streptomyces acidicola]|uniref:LPXTG cell wall anchor domain-containing protein n=1 Tax=Streptomyces acidicola TaxID=2596892 RepID=A0A5N8X6V7_9ACTN|nr:SCO1860 family LAETG-anchored protein [Streptomyces acidicola]MPY55122.1 LPXTG cell wall anchor domain-containing protein [Streptomyces acidicola]
MNGNNFRLPARRLAATAAATVIAAGPAVLVGAGAAHATENEGRASAVVLRTGLDVSLVNKTVNVPLTVSLNEVQAPADADRSTLSARLDGVDGGQSFTVLRADVATAKATASATKAEGRTDLANAKIHVPGLPLLSLIELEGVTSRATCEAGEQPVAESNLAGGLTVLGKKVTVSADGTTEVKVPGVGEVVLDISRKDTTSRTAAATALELKVSVNPLELNVAEVEGTVTLASATCESPAAASSTSDTGSDTGSDAGSDAGSGSASEVKPQGAASESDLAETGGNSMTPYIAGGAVALLAAGGGAVALARRAKG